MSGCRLMLAGCVLAAVWWLWVGAPWVAVADALAGVALWWVERVCRDLDEPVPLSRPVPRPMPGSRLPLQPQPFRPPVTAQGGRNRPMPVTFRPSPVPRGSREHH